MLKQFRVNNFKSLLNVAFAPSGVNLIVGPNNAGKTNLCAALRFLGLSSKSTLDAAALAAVGERWNLTNFYVSNQREIEFEIQAVLKFASEEITYSYFLRLTTTRGEAAGAESLTVLEETLRLSGGGFRDTLLLENKAGQTSLLHEEGGRTSSTATATIPTGAKIATNATMLSQLFELENNPRVMLFRRYLQSWSFYNFSSESLRLPDVARDDGALLSSGANLSRALFDLHNEKPRIERKLIEMVKQVEPKLDLLSYSAPDPEHVHVFLEDEKGHRVSARGTSDGTLRFMAIFYVILMSAQTAGNFAPLIIMEEPENGLYVGVLKPLMQRIPSNGESGQFIFTSHSPYFIDLFDADLTGIHVVTPGRPSSVLSKPDANNIHQLLDEMSLGEMHFRNLLK